MLPNNLIYNLHRSKNYPKLSEDSTEQSLINKNFVKQGYVKYDIM